MSVEFGDWRTGFGMPGRVAAALPPVGLAVAAVAVATSDDGDIRAGIFPMAMAFAVATLIAPIAGSLSSRSGRTSVWTRAGAAWSAAALASLSAGFLAVAMGAIFGIDEDAVGPMAWIVVAALAFGLLSTTPAMTLLAFGVSRDRLLPRFGRLALWVGAPVLPVLLIFGGLAEGTLETVGSTLLLAIFGLAWIVVGAAAAVAHRQRSKTSEPGRV